MEFGDFIDRLEQENEKLRERIKDLPKTESLALIEVEQLKRQLFDKDKTLDAGRKEAYELRCLLSQARQHRDETEAKCRSLIEKLDWAQSENKDLLDKIDRMKSRAEVVQTDVILTHLQKEHHSRMLADREHRKLWEVLGLGDPG
jgi:uncharacterized coiled-coil DUF342 family protein